MNKNDGAAALCGIGIGLVSLIVVLQLPFGTFRESGPAFFPTLLSLALMLVSLFLLGQYVKAKMAERKREGKEDQKPLLASVDLGPHWKKVILAVAGLVAYVFLLRPVGFLLSTTLATILFVRLMSPSWKLSFLISILCTIFSYVFFAWLLKNPLPKGIVYFL